MKKDKIQKVLYLVLLVLSYILACICIVHLTLSGIRMTRSTIVFCIELIFISIISGVLALFKLKNPDNYSEKLKETIHYTEDTLNSEVKEETTELDALKLMLLNLENINDYYRWNRKQAKAAFGLAVALCVGGFILIFSAVLSPIIFKIDTSAAIITAIGGAIVELIAATALVVYKKSLSQLNHYHQALHEDERFLSSINLLNKFSTEELKDAMLKHVIESEIKMNIIAAKRIGRSGVEDREDYK